MPYDDKIVVVADAPQQEAGSVDCGAVVLYVIHKYINHEPIVRTDAVEDMKGMHANILNTLLMWGRDSQSVAQKRVRREDVAGPSSF